MFCIYHWLAMSEIDKQADRVSPDERNGNSLRNSDRVNREVIDWLLSNNDTQSATLNGIKTSPFEGKRLKELILDANSLYANQPDSATNSSYQIGLEEIDKARKSIGDRDSRWNELNVYIENAISSADKAEYLNTRENEFPQTTEHISAAMAALRRGEFKEVTGSQSGKSALGLKSISTIQCHSDSAKSTEIKLPSIEHERLARELKQIETPSITAKIDNLQNSLDLFMRVEDCVPEEEARKISKLASNFRKSRKDNKEVVGVFEDALKQVKRGVRGSMPQDVLLYSLESKFSLSKTESHNLIAMENRGASKEFYSFIQNAVEKVPKPIIDRLSNEGYHILTCKKGTDLDKSGRKLRGYSDEATPDYSGGWQGGSNIVVCEIQKVDDRQWSSGRASITLGHEIGHALDKSMKWYSNSAEFKSAYNDVVSRLSEDEKASIEYFLQKGDAGRQELFAELCAKSLFPKEDQRAAITSWGYKNLDKFARLQQMVNSQLRGIK